LLEGFITFVHVDRNGNPLAHHITIEPNSEEDIALFYQATSLRKSEL